jgi:hypothetical protein
MSLCGPHFLFTHQLILDNIVVPVVYEDRCVDILPHRFRRSDAEPCERQHVRDVALDRLLNIVAQEFETDGIPQLWGTNSRGSLFELKDDDHLTTALILFLQFAWTGRHQHLPGLEVRLPPGMPRPPVSAPPNQQSIAATGMSSCRNSP